MREDLNFTTKEAAEVYSVGAEHPVTVEQLQEWMQLGGVQGDTHSMADLLAGHVVLSLARALPDAKPETVLWLAGEVLSQVEGAPWNDLPTAVRVPLDDEGAVSIVVNVREHYDVLKERVAVWKVDAEERTAAARDAAADVHGVRPAGSDWRI